jgi:hypothetical protein
MARQRDNDEQYSDKETQRRLNAILHGAFSGPPTPLKDIPTRHGESRKMRLTTGGASF